MRGTKHQHPARADRHFLAGLWIAADALPLAPYGKAAERRNLHHLAALKRIQAQQIVTAEAERDADVLAIVGEAGEYCVSVMLVRGGRNLGTTSYFPRAPLAEPGEALASFAMQYYADAAAPPEVLLSFRDKTDSSQ